MVGGTRWKHIAGGPTGAYSQGKHRLGSALPSPSEVLPSPTRWHWYSLSYAIGQIRELIQSKSNANKNQKNTQINVRVGIVLSSVSAVCKHCCWYRGKCRNTVRGSKGNSRKTRFGVSLHRSCLIGTEKSKLLPLFGPHIWKTKHSSSAAWVCTGCCAQMPVTWRGWVLPQHTVPCSHTWFLAEGQDARGNMSSAPDKGRLAKKRKTNSTRVFRYMKGWDELEADLSSSAHKLYLKSSETSSIHYVSSSGSVAKTHGGRQHFMDKSHSPWSEQPDRRIVPARQDGRFLQSGTPKLLAVLNVTSISVLS